MLHLWGEDLALDQPEVPQEIAQEVKGKLTEVATIVLWMSPSPWSKLDWTDLQKDSVALFVEKSQAKLWADGKKGDVFEYFKTLVENKISPSELSNIPAEINEIVENRLNKSVLTSIWELPSPWLWGIDPGDDRDDRLDGRRSPKIMWKDGYKEQVINYFRVVADNLEPPLSE